MDRLLNELNLNFDLFEFFVIIKIDNQRTIVLFENSKFQFKTKNIDVQ